MKIKNYRCKCGSNDFFFADKGNQKGIYCSYCGKWLKWADKDEQNLTLKRTDNSILDKIKEEIEQRSYGIANDSVIQGMIYERANNLKIIDKYKDKGLGNESWNRSKQG